MDSNHGPQSYHRNSEARYHLDKYLARLKLQGRSPTYINSIDELLNKFVTTVTIISPDTALDFLSRYADRKPATKAAYSIYLRGFLKFLGMEFDFRVKVSHSLPAFIQYEDLEKLKGAIREKATHKRTMFRDLTLIETAMKTGMRRGEIANLQPRHIDFANHRVMVVGGKGAKDRVIPLFPTLEPLLMKLCEDKSPNDKVFGLKGSSIGSMFTVWAKKAGVELHAHSMRHYFATTLVERGANIRAVQELLGHTSLSTTQVYIAVTVKHLEHAINLLE